MSSSQIRFPARPAPVLTDSQVHAAVARGRRLHGRALRGAFAALWQGLRRQPDASTATGRLTPQANAATC